MFIIISLLIFLYLFYIKKEQFKVVEPDSLEYKQTNNNPYKETPIINVSYADSKRFPYTVENTTNLHSVDTPVLGSNVRLGTNLGK